MPRARRQSIPIATANSFAPLAFLPQNWHPNLTPPGMLAFPPLNPLMRPPLPVQWPARPPSAPVQPASVVSVLPSARVSQVGGGKRGADASPQTTPSKPSRAAVAKKTKSVACARVPGVCSDPEDQNESTDSQDTFNAEYTRRTGRKVCCMFFMSFCAMQGIVAA